MEKQHYGVKITVMKREFFPDLAADLDIDDEYNRDFGLCPCFNIGDVILVSHIDEIEIPSNFPCHWAWADLKPDIALIQYGGQPQPVLKNPNSMYSCCDSGMRPVVFKLERIVLPD